MNLQTSVNILQNRDWQLVYQSSTCCIYNSVAQYLVTPLKSLGSIPNGTLDTLFRAAYTPHKTSFKGQHTKKIAVPVVPVVLEKKGGQLWGRVELQGILIITSGATHETTISKLQTQLNELTNYLSAHDIDREILPNDFVFNFHHDLTCVRELFQRFKINHLADQTNIPQELLSQFLTNKQHPSTKEAQKIEMLIQQLGREMINFSLL
ncbi:hypothetical protein [Spirosoma fluviale]|uniref:Uncharacterized protein n=1 Tax=Spirosoma fluviale TaxID=1597977 RepID=A0A286G9B1_9BACT|nr:hypothetical protein [Spirosoma fluviale]SOD91806.1 hypothetical protein SAMN06269250_3649 [Spirosoma fluviale]